MMRAQWPFGLVVALLIWLFSGPAPAAEMHKCFPLVSASEQKIANGTTWQVEASASAIHYFIHCEDAVGNVKPYGYLWSYAGGQYNTGKAITAAAWARAQARIDIDTAAGRARMRYLTSVPGQDATYTAKYEQAKEYIAANYPSDASAYPWIANEAAASGLTPTQAADRIKGLGDAWAGVIGPAIEGLRVGGKDALPGLATVASVLIHSRAVVAQLDAV